MLLQAQFAKDQAAGPSDGDYGQLAADEGDAAVFPAGNVNGPPLGDGAESPCGDFVGGHVEAFIGPSTHRRCLETCRFKEIRARRTGADGEGSDFRAAEVFIQCQ